MSGLGFILILILIGFIVLGFAVGLVQTLGSVIGIILATYVAGNLFQSFGLALSFFFLGNVNLAQWVIFIVLFMIVNRLFGLLFWVVEVFFKLFSVIPFVKTFNRVGGAVLGLVEGLLAISMFLYIGLRFPIGVAMTEAVLNSSVAKGFLAIAKILSPLLPESVQMIVF